MSDVQILDELLFKPPLGLIIIFFSTSFVVTLTSCIVVKSKYFPRVSLTVAGILLEFLLAVFAFIVRINFTIGIRRRMEESFYAYDTLPNRTYTNLMDTLQNHFKCCGIDSHQQWLQVYRFVPHSCNASMRLRKAEYRGCFSVIKNLSAFYWNRTIISIFMFFVVKITILGLYECNDYAPEVEEKEPEDADELSHSI